MAAGVGVTRPTRSLWFVVIGVCVLIDVYLVWYQDTASSASVAHVQTQSQPQPPLQPVEANIKRGAQPASPPAPAELPPLPPALAPPPPPADATPETPEVSDSSKPKPSVLKTATTSTQAVSVGTVPSLSALEYAAAQLNTNCRVLVATVAFEASALLRQPHYCRTEAAQDTHRRAQRPNDAKSPSSSGPRVAVCHVAFVDWQSERLIKHVQVRELRREHDEAFIGCWQLLRTPAGLPYTHGASNALLASMHLPTLFATRAEFSWWVDVTRQLRASTAEVMEGAAVGAMEGDAALLVSVRSLPSGGDDHSHGGDGAHLLLRRHAPIARVQALTNAWWQQWEAIAGSHTPSSRPGATFNDANGEHDAVAHAAAAALAALRADGTHSSAFMDVPSDGGPTLSSAQERRSLLPSTRPVDTLWRHLWPKAPLNARRTFAPPPERPPTADSTPRVEFAAAPSGGRNAGFGAGHGGGAIVTNDERHAALRLSPSAHEALPCGFMMPSVYDAAAKVGATHASHCTTVTLTAIFDAFDELIQPTDDVMRKASAEELSCFYAFVDRHSHDLLLQENARRVTTRVDGGGGGPGGGVSRKVGVWHLILLEGNIHVKMPYSSSRRNSRVPKLLAHRLFPKAHHALWIDSKLELHATPTAIRKRFMPSGSGAVFAAYRNLKRDRIDEERDWIWRHKCADDTANCPELLEQWATYEAEQPSPTWFDQTVAIEGSLLLQDLRAPLHNALFCAWFNEYSRFGERDQMAISYVMHRMGLTRHGTNASHAVRLIERSYHYLTKPSKRPLTLVVKVGHRSGSRRLKP